MPKTLRAQLDDLRSAYGASYEPLQRDLYRFLLTRVGGSARLAHDLAAEALHRGWERLLSFRGADLRPWLFRIAHNLVVDHHRDQQRHAQPLPVELPERHQRDEEEGRLDVTELLQLFHEQVKAFQEVLERVALVLPEPKERPGRPSRQEVLPQQVKILRQASKMVRQFLEEEMGTVPRESEK